MLYEFIKELELSGKLVATSCSLSNNNKKVV